MVAIFSDQYSVCAQKLVKNTNFNINKNNWINNLHMNKYEERVSKFIFDRKSDFYRIWTKSTLDSIQNTDIISWNSIHCQRLIETFDVSVKEFHFSIAMELVKNKRSSNLIYEVSKNINDFDVFEKKLTIKLCVLKVQSIDCMYK